VITDTGIFFRTHERKALEILVYIADHRPGLSPTELSSILFLAEQEHLLDWGRPIYGDVYTLKKKIVVPQLVKDILEGNHIFTEITSEVSSSVWVDIVNGKPCIYAKRKANADVFSESDKEALDKFLIKNADALKLLIESNETIIRSLDNIPISYEHFIPDSFESKAAFIEQLREFMYFGMFFN
jgi:hypothetical protein